MDQYLLTESLEEIWKVIKKCNGYIDEQAPWKLKKSDIYRMNTVLYILVTAIKKISFLTQSFIPEGSGKILSQLCIDPNKRTYKDYEEEIKFGIEIAEPTPIFPRIDDN